MNRPENHRHPLRRFLRDQPRNLKVSDIYKFKFFLLFAVNQVRSADINSRLFVQFQSDLTWVYFLSHTEQDTSYEGWS